MPAPDPGLKGSDCFAETLEQVRQEGVKEQIVPWELAETKLPDSFYLETVETRIYLYDTCFLFLAKTPWKPDGYTKIKQTWWVVLELGF